MNFFLLTAIVQSSALERRQGASLGGGGMGGIGGKTGGTLSGGGSAGVSAVVKKCKDVAMQATAKAQIAIKVTKEAKMKRNQAKKSGNQQIIKRTQADLKVCTENSQVAQMEAKTANTLATQAQTAYSSGKIEEAITLSQKSIQHSRTCFSAEREVKGSATHMMSIFKTFNINVGVFKSLDIERFLGGMPIGGGSCTSGC